MEIQTAKEDDEEVGRKQERKRKKRAEEDSKLKARQEGENEQQEKLSYLVADRTQGTCAASISCRTLDGSPLPLPTSLYSTIHLCICICICRAPVHHVLAASSRSPAPAAIPSRLAGPAAGLAARPSAIHRIRLHSSVNFLYYSIYSIEASQPWTRCLQTGCWCGIRVSASCRSRAVVQGVSSTSISYRI